jgi:hypothetical protein
MTQVAALIAPALVSVRVNEEKLGNAVSLRIENPNEMRENSPLTDPHGEVEDAIFAGSEGLVHTPPGGDHVPKGSQMTQEKVPRKDLRDIADPNSDEGVLSRPTVNQSAAASRPADPRAEALQSSEVYLLRGNTHTKKLRSGDDEGTHHIRNRKLEIPQHEIVPLILGGHGLDSLQVHK